MKEVSVRGGYRKKAKLGLFIDGRMDGQRCVS